jgi:hypothetical protein
MAVIADLVLARSSEEASLGVGPGRVQIGHFCAEQRASLQPAGLPGRGGPRCQAIQRMSVRPVGGTRRCLISTE